MGIYPVFTLHPGFYVFPSYAWAQCVDGTNMARGREQTTGCPLSTRKIIIKQNWNQFLLVVKATALKQQISNFYPQSTDASDHIVSVNVAMVAQLSYCWSASSCTNGRQKTSPMHR